MIQWSNHLVLCKMLIVRFPFVLVVGQDCRQGHSKDLTPLNNICLTFFNASKDGCQSLHCSTSPKNAQFDSALKFCIEGVHKRTCFFVPFQCAMRQVKLPLANYTVTYRIEIFRRVLLLGNETHYLFILIKIEQNDCLSFLLSCINCSFMLFTMVTKLVFLMARKYLDRRLKPAVCCAV